MAFGPRGVVKGTETGAIRQLSWRYDAKQGDFHQTILLPTIHCWLYAPIRMEIGSEWGIKISITCVYSVGNDLQKERIFLWVFCVEYNACELCGIFNFIDELLSMVFELQRWDEATAFVIVVGAMFHLLGTMCKQEANFTYSYPQVWKLLHIDIRCIIWSREMHDFRTKAWFVVHLIVFERCITYLHFRECDCGRDRVCLCTCCGSSCNVHTRWRLQETWMTFLEKFRSL